jgi:two-component system chemotaxis response regulator CheY
MLRYQFGAEVVAAASGDEALAQLGQAEFHLILVNRVFDRSGDEGLAFIQELLADPQLRQVPLMLVSNYADAQAQAVAAGAQPGFGKDALTHGATLSLLRPHLG